MERRFPDSELGAEDTKLGADLVVFKSAGGGTGDDVAESIVPTVLERLIRCRICFSLVNVPKNVYEFVK